jgi:hypothetical protein
MSKQAIKTALEKYPAVYATARAGYVAAALSWNELSTLARMGPSLLLRPFRRASALWRRELPVQNAPCFAIRWPDGVKGSEDLLMWARAFSHDAPSGRHSIYLPPETWAASTLAPIAAHYPEGCGLKISRSPGGANEPYAIPRPGHTVQRRYSMPHRQQLLIYNCLQIEGIAPRLYDVIELEDESGVRWAAYVVEHVRGGKPGAEHYESVTTKLRALEADGVIRLVTPGGWGGADFGSIDCNGNLIARPDGSAVYVDVHSFVLDRYEKHLLQTAQAAAAVSHFGSRSFILGGRGGSYLYQAVPGSPLPAKRSPSDRMLVWDELLASAGVSLDRKVVFDVGCNIGLMSAEYLRRGARWIHGWDMPAMVQATRRVLLGIGCTRFSLTGCVLSPDRALTADLPTHLAGVNADDAVVNYLAMRRHIGWLEGLRALPWRHMFYEGHEGDEPFDVYLSNLQAVVPVRVLGRRRVTDANSSDREIALIERI